VLIGPLQEGICRRAEPPVPNIIGGSEPAAKWSGEVIGSLVCAEDPTEGRSPFFSMLGSEVVSTRPFVRAPSVKTMSGKNISLDRAPVGSSNVRKASHSQVHSDRIEDLQVSSAITCLDETVGQKFIAISTQFKFCDGTFQGEIGWG
jgi:hypothetical protein